MSMWIVWVVIALVAVLIEIFTLGFAIICFAVGAGGAAIAAAIGGGMMWQLAIFSALSLFAMVVVRPLAIKSFKRKEVTPTNLNAIVGRQGRVSERIHQGAGRVTIDGDDWRAEIADHTAVIEVGERVEVVSVNSTILTVKKVE